MIAGSKIFEVYESREGKRRQLYTVNLITGKKVYGERLVVENGVEYREWDAFKSKLAASILKGSPSIFIRKNDVVLYLGSASGTTVSHVSDIVGDEGAVFAVDIAPRVMRDLIFLSYQRENILPIMLKASLLISAKIKDAQFIIAKSPQLDLALYNRITKASYINLKIIDGLAYDCLNVSDFCLVASGTATLETAIMQKPFVVIYKLGLLNYLLYRPQVKTPYIGMVNIVAGGEIVPEFIQFKAIPEKIAEEILKNFDNPSERERMKYGLAQVKASLGESGAASRAAKIIIDFLNKA